ncbi:MAG TPA: Calx-beta domain-containing protein [Kofleriaceae bacterium]
MTRRALLAVLLVASCGDNIRPDISGIVLVVDKPASVTVTEAGDTATFTVALSAAPPDNVTISVGSSDPTEGTTSPATITLTPENFSIPVRVTVTGEDDLIADGDQEFTINVDAGRAGMEAVAVTNTDNDSPGATVSPVDDLETTEAGGMDTFTVVLNTEPTSEVTVPIASSDPTEGTAEPASLVFTPENWNAPQTVTIMGVEDALDDGPIDYTIELGAATSTDTTYNGQDFDDPAVTNIDNDSPGVVVTPTNPMRTTEAGGTASFSVVLTSQPTADVSIAMTSSDPGEGTVPAIVTFTNANWDAPQSITVTGVDDPLDDGDQGYTIVLAPTTSTDPGYVGIDPDDVDVTNIDDESPGFVVSPESGLITTEAGGTDEFTVALVSAPTADVTISVTSSDPGEGTPSVASLTFTTADWFLTKTVTVTGVNDDVADGNQPYQIVLGPATSADPAYNGFDPPDVGVTNTDNDTPGITVTPVNGLLVSELGDKDTFTIVLNSQPTANVTLTVQTTDNTEGFPSPTSVTFTPTDWFMARTITVTGRDDTLADGNQVFRIRTNAATSADPGYNGVNPPDVVVTNIDDDVAAVVVISPPIMEVTEAGGMDTFSVVLTTQPTANVTCSLQSLDTSEGTIDKTNLTFTPLNYDQEQVVTVTGVDDTEDDGDQLFIIRVNICFSADPSYNLFNPRDPPARNIDND